MLLHSTLVVSNFISWEVKSTRDKSIPVLLLMTLELRKTWCSHTLCSASTELKEKRSHADCKLMDITLSLKMRTLNFQFWTKMMCWYFSSGTLPLIQPSLDVETTWLVNLLSKLKICVLSMVRAKNMISFSKLKVENKT